MAKKKVLESMAVMWTFEESPNGEGWAAFIHVGGVSTRLSPWYATVEELTTAVAGNTLDWRSAAAPPTKDRAGDVTPAPAPPGDGPPDAPA
jgi:hypothetical protein